MRFEPTDGNGFPENLVLAAARALYGSEEQPFTIGSRDLFQRQSSSILTVNSPADIHV
jgi:hypothetical protein